MPLHTFDLLIRINSVDKFIDMTSLICFLSNSVPNGSCKVRVSLTSFGRDMPPPLLGFPLVKSGTSC